MSLRSAWRELILLQRAWRGHQYPLLLDDATKSCRILSKTDQSPRWYTNPPCSKNLILRVGSQEIYALDLQLP